MLSRLLIYVEDPICEYTLPPLVRSHTNEKNTFILLCVPHKFYLWTTKWTHSSRKIIAFFVILVNYSHSVKVAIDSEGSFFCMCTKHMYIILCDVNQKSVFVDLIFTAIIVIYTFKNLCNKLWCKRVFFVSRMIYLHRFLSFYVSASFSICSICFCFFFL